VNQPIRSLHMLITGENQPKLTGSMNKCYTHICGPGQDVVRWLI